MTADPPEPASPSAETSEVECDVVVVGSGAAGMTAALTAAHRGADVLVVEKAATFGGSTARSGGGVWIPNNEVLTAAGAPDDPQRAAEYLAHVTGGETSEQRRRALLEHGPDALALVRRTTPLEFTWIRGYSDYYPEGPGGLALGRTVEPLPLDGSVLGDELANLNPPYVTAPAGMTVTAADYKWLNLIARHPRGLLTAARVYGHMVLRRLRGRRGLALGQALAAGLRAGLLRAGVPVWLNCPLVDLHVTGGRVDGVHLRRNGEPVLVRARRGVVLASGGFERNPEMREQHQRAPISTAWTTGAHENTGDGILAGQRHGGALDLMDSAWWGPSIPLSGGPYFCLSERSLPGCVLVNQAGQRFVNESAPYIDAVEAMYAGHETGIDHIPSWLVFDQRYRNRYTFAGLPPRQPFPGRWREVGAVRTARDLDELARAIGAPAGQLKSTVERFNAFARSGEDADFHRGESAYDHYYGDPTLHPNPGLAELVKPPFHAVRIVPGDLGTKGGLRTDERARVLDGNGDPLPGLHAAGNVSAAVMGRSYAGAGATIGPAMTFGYLAARELTAPNGDRRGEHRSDQHTEQSGGTR